MAVVYRRAAADELQQLAWFCAEAYEGDRAYFERRWEHDPAPESFNAVLEERGAIVAHLRVFARQIFVRRRAPPQPCAGIGNVAVATTHRGRRLANALLQEAVADCRASGFAFSLLYTHVPAVYESVGFQVLPVHELAVTGVRSAPWREVAVDSRLQNLYERDHGGRPGTVARDSRWWQARDGWLRAEGWRSMGIDGVAGYCYVRGAADGGQVDEAVGECAALVRAAPPGEGSWQTRVPLGVSPRATTPPDAVRMGLAIDGRLDLSALTSAGAVSWRTDEF